jgi:hypothetical protein
VRLESANKGVATDLVSIVTAANKLRKNNEGSAGATLP